jgi:hypothetical protein
LTYLDRGREFVNVMHAIPAGKIEVPIALGARHRCRHVGAVSYLPIAGRGRGRRPFVVEGRQQQNQHNCGNSHHCVTFGTVTPQAKACISATIPAPGTPRCTQVNSLRCDHDLIASPACMVMKAADKFKNKKTAPNQLWQTDFTYARQLTSWVCLSISRGRIYAQL